jgi:hypothetical protein
MATFSSYHDNGLAENEPLAKRFQKHPRGTVKALWPRLYSRMKTSLASTGVQSPGAVTLSATSVPSNATVGTVVGNLATTQYGTGTPDTFTYSLASNPQGYFKIVGAALQIATALPGPGSTKVSVKTTGSTGETTTTSFTITLL